MTSLIIPGNIYFLDGKTEVVVLKPATRSNLSYTVEIPGRSIETVSSDRLSPLSEAPQQKQGEEIFEYDE